VLSLAVVVWVDFRTGAVLLAAGVLWAALLRWRLSDEAAGLLRVRRRRIDLTVLTLLGSAMLVLALVVPHH
jgi:predicted small integral membrane protein